MTLFDRADKVISPTLGIVTYLNIVKAQGCYVTDIDGKTYLDFTSGTAVANLGHNHPAVMAAIKKQLDICIHTGGNWLTESMVKVGEVLQQITPGDLNQFFFLNSGSEAIEGALKMARWVTGRRGYIAFENAFHGRTLGCTAITSSALKYRKKYQPLLSQVYLKQFPYCYRCPYKMDASSCDMYCVKELERSFIATIPTEDIAAIVVEAVQGEGGYIAPPFDFLRKLREICDREGMLLIIDEVQSGMGRTGQYFACEWSNIVPDIICIAKGIANGLPLSAVASSKALFAKWEKGAHGTTFGGNPVACAASIAVVETFLNDGILDKMPPNHEYMISRLSKMQENCEFIGDIRGLGYMIGVEFVKARETKVPYTEFVEKLHLRCLEKGLIILDCGTYGNVIRLIPPLVIEKEDVTKGMDILEETIQELST